MSFSFSGKNLITKFVIGLYIATLLILTVYSYSQIDLNLTLSSNRFYQNIQQQLIQLGYFNRLLSSAIYIFIIFSLFFCYLYFLKHLRDIGLIRIIIFLTAIILLFAYPAFSEDIFNYIFDARILVLYQKNPWQYKPLNFPMDEWLRFMRNIHTPSVYGPFWNILISIPYLLGLGKFTLTLFNFKFFVSLFYLFSSYLIYKTNGGRSLLFFSLNPLILIESLVSAHNDMIMLAFGLASLFYLKKEKLILSLINLLLSIMIKFLTTALIPMFLFFLFYRKKFDKSKIPNWGNLYASMIFFYFFALIYLIFQREFQSWYLIVPVGLASFLVQKHKLFSNLMIFFTFGAMVRYIPYLGNGEYNLFVRQSREVLTFLPPVLYISLNFFRDIFKIRPFIWGKR